MLATIIKHNEDVVPWEHTIRKPKHERIESNDPMSKNAKKMAAEKLDLSVERHLTTSAWSGTQDGPKVSFLHSDCPKLQRNTGNPTWECDQ